MGTDVHLMAVGTGGDLEIEAARRRIDDLEQRWSRFLPHTELAQINATAGSDQPCAVSAVTFAVIELALDWWRRTEGLFDPSVLAALLAAGYDRSFELGPGPVGDAPGAAPGCDGVVLDGDRMTVLLPAGLGLDLGGIGKGAAADLVSDELEDTPEIEGGCVNLGGDLRVWGTAPSGEGWPVGVDGPFGPGAGADHVIGLHAGAVATSSTAKRTWRGAGGSVAHHIIDPRTGRPAESDLVQVTVIAGDVVTAEVLAKAALLEGTDAGTALLERHNVTACITRGDGSSDDLGGYEAYRW